MSTTFHLDDGAKIIVNNPSLVPEVAAQLKESRDREVAFHQQLLSLGVKAYRCNDGWVDRQNHIVTFFRDERNRGWYWGNLHLKSGDLIYIGNAYKDGCFARVDMMTGSSSTFSSYHYDIIDISTIKDRKGMKAKLKAVWRILRAKEWFYITDKQGQDYCFDWDFMATMPEKATSVQFADLILRQSAKFVQAIKLSADKIFKQYHLGGSVDEVIADMDLRRFLTTYKIERMVWEDGTIKDIKFKSNKE